MSTCSRLFLVFFSLSFVPPRGLPFTSRPPHTLRLPTPQLSTYVHHHVVTPGRLPCQYPHLHPPAPADTPALAHTRDQPHPHHRAPWTLPALAVYSQPFPCHAPTALHTILHLQLHHRHRLTHVSSPLPSRPYHTSTKPQWQQPRVCPDSLSHLGSQLPCNCPYTSVTAALLAILTRSWPPLIACSRCGIHAPHSHFVTAPKHTSTRPTARIRSHPRSQPAASVLTSNCALALGVNCARGQPHPSSPPSAPAAPYAGVP